MRIGLINLEPKIVNTALMQISQYHKQKGDSVDWAIPLEYDKYDKLYCSSLFSFTDKSQLPDRVICGGSGVDLTTSLSQDIERSDYDYSIYPDCDYSIVWFSRGCIRNCPFCLVQKKEGKIRPVRPKKLNPKGKYIVVQDNNFFANPDWYNAISQLAEWNQGVVLQGIDIRTLDDKKYLCLNQLFHYKQIKIAWDNPKEDLRPKIELMLKYIKAYKIMCYVLIGYWSTPEEDLYRIETLRDYKIDPFAMPYNKKDIYQKRFARWVNHKAIFKTVKWTDYK